MLAAAVILAVCAALAHVALHAPPWAVGAIAAGAVAVWVAVSVSALSFAVLLAYPAALAGLAGCLSFSRWSARDPVEPAAGPTADRRLPRRL